MFDWTFVTHYAPFFVSGAEMTLFISVFGIVLFDRGRTYLRKH